MRELRRRDQERAASIAELQALINEGIASGVSELTFDDIIAEARAQADALDAT